MKIINASNKNSNMPFSRSEFSKIFEDLFYDDVILCNYFPRKLFRRKAINESLPTTCELTRLTEFNSRETRTLNHYNLYFSYKRCMFR